MSAFSMTSMNDLEKLQEISKKCYKDQAVWFINAFWAQGPELGEGDASKCEDVWNYVQLCAELDLKDGAAGTKLDEFKSHRVLEKLEEALTVKDMREVLREADIDFDKHVTILEFMIYKYKIDYKVMVNAAQGDVDEGAMQAAEDALKAAQAAMADCESKAESAKASEAAAKASEAAALEAEAKAKAAEDHQRDLEGQAAAALAELQAIEDAHNNKCAELEAKGSDETLGVVSRGRAKAELAGLKSKDPLPLTTAKINQEACGRKMAKATKVAAAATMVASTARGEAEATRASAEADLAAAEAAVDASVESFQAAQKAVDKVKAECKSAGKGKIWWMDRELTEAKKFMSSKQLAKLAAMGK